MIIKKDRRRVSTLVLAVALALCVAGSWAGGQVLTSPESAKEQRAQAEVEARRALEAQMKEAAIRAQRARLEAARRAEAPAPVARKTAL